MRIYLATTSVPRKYSCVPAFEKLARRDTVGEHSLVDDPGDADAVLFTECHLLDWKLREITRHALTRALRHKTYVYNERDDPWRVLPGIYVSYPRRGFDANVQAASAYYRIDDVRRAPGWNDIEPDLLFSFIASPTHRDREPLFDLRHERAVVARITGFSFYDPSSSSFARRQLEFAETLRRSKFVLCPRGAGTSSIRLYEVMASGRVPVILADEWVPPSGPDWSAFALTHSQSKVDGLIELLEAHEGDAGLMGARAREEYEQWFAPDISFHRMAERLRSLATNGATAVFERQRRDRRFFAVGGRLARQRSAALGRKLHPTRIR